MMELKCVNNCEFLKFKNHRFYCDLYGDDGHDLNHAVELDKGTVHPLRCEACVRDHNQYEVLKDLENESE